ncbi:MAG: MucB/RseB C-terminal domain-containing protein, partial [bacterium]
TCTSLPACGLTTPSSSSPEHLKDQQFTTVDSLRRRSSARKYHDMAALMSSYTETLLIPNKLPSGFTLQRIRAFQKERKSFVHLHYGDGLSMISLFQRKNGDSDWHRRGSRRQRGSSLTMTQGEMAGVHYHIVGEIAASELEEMADSLVPITRKKTQQLNYFYFIAIVFVFISGFYLVKRFREKSDV